MRVGRGGKQFSVIFTRSHDRGPWNIFAKLQLANLLSDEAIATCARDQRVWSMFAIKISFVLRYSHTVTLAFWSAERTPCSLQLRLCSVPCLLSEGRKQDPSEPAHCLNSTFYCCAATTVNTRSPRLCFLIPHNPPFTMKLAMYPLIVFSES